jgi:hypothetical protein
MSVKDIRAALEVQLAAMVPAIATAHENVAFTPQSGVPYQRAYLIPATTENPALGSTLKRESGVFQVSLHYPVNKGSAAAYERADLVRAHFYRGLTLQSNATIVTVQRTPSIGPARTDGDRFVVPLSVPYFANLFI